LRRFGKSLVRKAYSAAKYWIKLQWKDAVAQRQGDNRSKNQKEFFSARNAELRSGGVRPDRVGLVLFNM